MNTCQTCGKETPNKKFCSKSCSAKKTNTTHPRRKKKPLNICVGCGKETENNKYCSNSCQGNHQSKLVIDRWLNGEEIFTDVPSLIRNYLIREAGNKCSICGWGEVNQFTGKVPVELDHIDGDSTNNDKSNLRIICPNCHSLTPTYKGANRNSGRVWRKNAAINKQSAALIVKRHNT